MIASSGTALQAPRICTHDGVQVGLGSVVHYAWHEPPRHLVTVLPVRVAWISIESVGIEALRIPLRMVTHPQLLFASGGACREHAISQVQLLLRWQRSRHLGLGDIYRWFQPEVATRIAVLETQLDALLAGGAS